MTTLADRPGFGAGSGPVPRGRTLLDGALPGVTCRCGAPVPADGRLRLCDPCAGALVAAILAMPATPSSVAD